MFKLHRAMFVPAGAIFLICMSCTLQGCEISTRPVDPGSSGTPNPVPATPGGPAPSPTPLEELTELTDPETWFDQIRAANGGKFRLQAKTYYMRGHYELPANTQIHGAGSDKISGTVIEVKGSYYDHICWENAGNRKGFLLGDNTYIGHLYFIGIADRRSYDNQLLCGGAVFETPGCRGTGNDWEYAPDDCGGDTGNNGDGVQGAKVEDIQIEANTAESVLYVAPTKKNAKVSKDIIIKNVRTNGVWADGMNIHGAHEDILVEGCDIRHCGDDIYAIWSIQPGANRITFKDNIGVDASYRRGGAKDYASGWGYKNQWCFAIYGGQESKHLNNQCEEAKHPVSFGNYGHRTPLFGGKFTDTSKAYVEGMTDLKGNILDDPCWNLDRFPGENFCRG